MISLVAPCQVREERMVNSLASASLTSAGARWRNMQVSMIWMVLCCQHTCCLTVINKYQTLASGVTSQRYHLRWHTPRSKRFASSWNVLEFRIQHMKSTVSRLIMMFQVNSCVSPRDARTPLHLAAALGNLPITQILIWVSLDFFIPFKLFCFFSVHLNFFLKWANVYVGILF